MFENLLRLFSASAQTINITNGTEPIRIVMQQTTNWTQYLGTILAGVAGVIIYMVLLAKSGAFGGGVGSSFILSKISKITKRNIILIKHTERGLFSQSMIDEETLRKISYVLNKFEGADFDLILHTPGGDVFSTLAISRLFKQYPGKIRAFVPLYSMSGGSLLALTCNELYMTKNASIGPIDPQLGSLFKFGSSASWNKIVEYKGKKAEDQSISFAMMGSQYTKTIRNHLLNILDFGLSAEQKEKFADFLTKGDIEHAFALTPLDLALFGVKVNIIEDKKLLTLFERIIGKQGKEGIHYYKMSKRALNKEKEKHGII